MKTQQYPLWATSNGGKVYLVIGWEPTSTAVRPIVVPTFETELPFAYAGRLIYSATEPKPAPSQLPPPRPSEAQTETIPRLAPWHG